VHDGKKCVCFVDKSTTPVDAKLVELTTKIKVGKTFLGIVSNAKMNKAKVEVEVKDISKKAPKMTKITLL